MKQLLTNLTISLLLSVATLHSKGQWNFSQEQTNVLINITNYTYIGNVYIGYNPYPNYSMYDAMQTELSTLQSRYDYATGILSTELQKLKSLELINDYNVSILEANKNQVIAFSEGAGAQVDYSIYDNFIKVYNYFTWIYSVPSVKTEIDFLTSLKTELYRIKNKDPDNFYKSDRYYELGAALYDLKRVNKDSISTLSWKYGLF